MSPALDWHDGIRVGAIGVGSVLLLVIALWFLKPVFATPGNLNLLIFFVLLVGICVVLGLPIALPALTQSGFARSLVDLKANVPGGKAGLMAIFAMGLGLFTPPFGVGFYAACAIGKVAPDQAIGRVWPHLGALFLALIAIAFSVDFDRLPVGRAGRFWRRIEPLQWP